VPGAPHVRRRAAIFVGLSVLAGAVVLALSIFSIARSHADTAIHMTVRRFAYSPREVHLTKGVPVVLEVTSLDVPHGFNLPDLGVRADIIPGRPARIRLVPARVGTFTFHCDVFCGGGHEELDGTIVVTE